MLRIYGVGGNLLKAVQSFYSESRACVRGESGVSEWFDTNMGLKQVCVMSPWLFNMHMDGVVREVNERVLGRGVESLGQDGNVWRVNQLLYADDTVLVRNSIENLQQLLNEFDNVCKGRKLKVNMGKCKVIVCGMTERR